MQQPGPLPMMDGFGGPSPAIVAKQRADSPHAHGGGFKVLVLLVHGDRDTVVTVEQSKAMDATLASAHQPHELLLPGADHDINIDEDRAKLFTALEAFLSASLH